MDKCMYANDSCLDCPDIKECKDDLKNEDNNKKNRWFENDKKGFIIVLSIYILLFFADLFSTIINKGLWKHLEANPLYEYAGLFGIILLNIVYVIGLTYFYNRKKASVTARFYVMFIMITIITTRMIVVTSNILIYLDPPTVAQAMAVTAAQKKETVTRLVLLNIIPFFNGALTWIVFKMDNYVFRRPKSEE